MPIEALGSTSACENHLREESYIVKTTEEFSSLLNRKIKGLAQSKIQNTNYGLICGHRVAASPQVVLNILPKQFRINLFEKKKKQDLFSIPDPVKERKEVLYHPVEKKTETKPPIGIFSRSFNGWINALLQIIIFISSLRTMFNYTPKSFSPFNDFIDEYLYDQDRKKRVTNAPTEPVLETLSRYFYKGNYFENEVVDLFGILNGIMNYVFPIQSEKSIDQKEGDLLALHPRSRISIENENIDFEEFISKNFIPLGTSNYVLPSELLINFRWFLKKPFRNVNKCNPPPLLFLCDELYLTTHYELDSFIEFRPDEFHSPAYLSYVKVNGMWFQCDDSRISQIRSNNLHIALSRSFLFHYKKIKLSNENTRLV